MRGEKARLEVELERRAIILAESLQESVIPLLQSNSSDRLNRLVERFGNRERLRGVAVYDSNSNILASTADLKPKISQPLPLIVNSIAENKPAGSFIHLDGKSMYLFTLPVSNEDKIIGALALFHDASYIDVRLKGIWKHNLLRFVISSLY